MSIESQLYHLQQHYPTLDDALRHLIEVSAVLEECATYFDQVRVDMVKRTRNGRVHRKDRADGDEGNLRIFTETEIQDKERHPRK